MLETNIRIVKPGNRLYVLVRRVVVSGSDLSVDLLERACNKLRYQCNLAAVPAPGETGVLLVATNKPVENIHLQAEEWELEVIDTGKDTFRLEFRDPVGEKVIPRLIERTLLANLAQRKDLWVLDSPRIFYENAPFRSAEGISAYRRYEVSALPIEDVGVGIVVDVSTAFFTEDNLAYFYNPDVSVDEQQRREQRFARLTGRQEDQKGTLLYDTGRHRSKCYFEAAPPGLTCATTTKLRVRGESYDSLLAYYRAVYPHLTIDADTTAILVSFPGIERPQPVAAERVVVRVMNKNVPEVLSSVDKINPQERRRLISAFWNRVGLRPLGEVAPGLFSGFWRPGPEHIRQLPIPDLIFGEGKILASPVELTPDSYRRHYRQRVKCLDKYGCYSVPPAMSRTLLVAYPATVGDSAPERLARDLVDQLSKWTGVPLSANLAPYETVGQATEKIKSLERGGVAVFILNNEPAAYYEASFHLPNWRIKRITEATLQEHHRLLQKGAWDRRSASFNREKGARLWESFIDMNSLALLYLLEAVPFRPKGLGSYEAQLVIDVGPHRVFFALSLLVARSIDQSPSFLLRSDVHRKTDIQHETINPIILADQIQSVFQDGFPRNFQPIRSLLILRDGTLYDREMNGVQDGINKLKERGFISPDADVDLVDLHKDSLKSIRIWEVDDHGQAENALEGWAISLNHTTALLTTTGAATLNQGTAEPLVLKSNGHCLDLAEAVQSAFVGSQMNWFSPGIAQRLPLAQKVADDELQARSAQEVRRLR